MGSPALNAGVRERTDAQYASVDSGYTINSLLDTFMKIQLNSYLLAIVLATSATAIVSGCTRQEAVAPAVAPAAAPATTTVGTDIDDTVVTTKVRSALLADDDVKGMDIKAETRKGVVLLSGFVNNQSQVERAIKVVRTVEGVKGVENGMTLKEGKVTVGNTVDDGIMTSRVKSALIAEPTIKSLDISVVTRKGEVQLSGFVDNQAQIDKAIMVARSVEGVKGLANELSIKK